MRSSVPKVLPSIQNDVPQTEPVGLFEYFTDKYNVILRCDPISIMDPMILGSIIIRETSDTLFKNDVTDIIHNGINTFISHIDKNILTTEEWVEEIFNSCPLCSDGTIIQYPKIITDSSLKKRIIPKITDFVKQYDLRIKDSQQEMKLIQKIEQAFENKSEMIYFHNTFTNILETIRKELDLKHLKYKNISEDIIYVKLAYIRELDIEYNLIDLL